jgi:hypothetical protein
MRHELNRAARIALTLLVAVCVTACRASAHAVPGASAAPAQPSVAAPVILTAGPLSLSITSPADNAVVNTAQVVLSGQAPPDTVITVNDTIVVVDASGQFSATLSLEEGPNELVVNASDPEGNEANSRLIVTYEPSS